MRALLVAILICLTTIANSAVAERLRVATFNASLTRQGPGLLLADLRKGEKRQLLAVADIIRTVRPDILLINEFDHDGEGLAAAAFTALLRKDGQEPGIDYPYLLALPSNTGRPTGLDLNGDGKLRGPADAFGYGNFAGQFGMLFLSRHPIDTAKARSFAKLKWKDFPGARLPAHPDSSPFPSAQAQEVMRLSSKSHWDIPVLVNARPLHIFASHPTPPVFDGPEDFNGKRNGDEIRFWVQYLDGSPFTDDQGRNAPRADGPFVVLGDLNADPLDGEGDHDAIAALLAHPLLQDPTPASQGAEAATQQQAGTNAKHKTPPAQDTADWRDSGGPGNLRVDYALPARALGVFGAGVFWPAPQEPGFALIGDGRPVSSDHRLVWVDIDF